MIRFCSQTLLSFLFLFLFLLQTNKVTACVVDGIVNRYPLARYTVGYDARIIRHCLSYLPSWIVDVVQTAQD